MGRILAIDYGLKRVGIAVSDPLKIIANGLPTIAANELMDFLSTYFLRESVEKVIIGMPKKMNNELSQTSQQIIPFINLFKKKFPSIPIEEVDERFTSIMAHQAMIDGGLKKMDRRDKGTVDMVSATIILQDYMNRKS